MGFLIEMQGKGELGLSRVGEICLDGLAREYSNRDKKFNVLRQAPFRTGSAETYDCYCLGKFETGFEGCVPTEILEVLAYRPESVQRIKNKKLRHLVGANMILPDWRIIVGNDNGALSRGVGSEVAGALVELQNIREIWHYWFDSRGNVDLEPASAVLSNF